jgi:DNA invertase Pin-like site-specific DNA recombinase
MRTAIGFVRVSTERQADSGLGLDAQRQHVIACAARLDLPLGPVFEEPGVSGTSALEDRPILMTAISALKRGDVLIVAKRDRLSRDIIVSSMVERLVTKRGARIVSAAGESSEGDDPASVMMRRMLDVFSSYEAALIAARTRAALAAKRRRGERISRFAPFGFKFGADGRSVEPEPGEQAIVRMICAHRADGLSLRRIASALNDAGVRTWVGTLWRFEAVRVVIRRRLAA